MLELVCVELPAWRKAEPANDRWRLLAAIEIESDVFRNIVDTFGSWVHQKHLTGELSIEPRGIGLERFSSVGEDRHRPS